MIVTSHYDTKGAFANFLDDFITVAKVLIEPNNVFIVYVIKPIIGAFIIDAHVTLTAVALRVHSHVLLLFSFFGVEEINLLMLKDLALFDVPEVLPERLECFIRAHWEPESMW